MEQRLLRLEDVADIFDGYRLAEAWDEMFAAPGKPRACYDGLVSVLQPMDPAELRYRADQLARVFTDRGVTYDYAGEERPFPLDLIPRVIDAARVGPGQPGRPAAGARRSRRSSADVYGPGEAFDDGVVPVAAWSSPARSSAARWPASPRPTASGCTWPAST